MNNNNIYKIGSFSLAGLLLCLVATTAVLFIPFSAAKIARQDAWMAPIIGTFLGAYILLIVYRLGILFPGKTLFEYLPLIVGKIFGKILGAGYIIYLFYLTSSVIREFLALLYGTGIFRLTPPTVVVLFFAAATTYAVLSGFEVIGRVIGIYAIIVSTIGLGSILLAVPYMKFDSLLPIGEAGFRAILKSEWVGLAYRGELLILSMILPYVKNERAGFIAANIANVLISFFIFNIIIAMITVLGVPTTARSIYALFYLPYFIPPTGITVFLVAIFVAAFWGKIALLQFVLSDGIGKLFNLKSYHYIVLPVAALLMVWSFSFYKNIPDVLVRIPTTFPGVALLFAYIIPTLLLLIAWVRTKFGSATDSNQSLPSASNN